MDATSALSSGYILWIGALLLLSVCNGLFFYVFMREPLMQWLSMNTMTSNDDADDETTIEPSKKKKKGSNKASKRKTIQVVEKQITTVVATEKSKQTSPIVASKPSAKPKPATSSSEQQAVKASGNQATRKKTDEVKLASSSEKRSDVNAKLKSSVKSVTETLESKKTSDKVETKPTVTQVAAKSKPQVDVKKTDKEDSVSSPDDSVPEVNIKALKRKEKKKKAKSQKKSDQKIKQSEVLRVVETSEQSDVSNDENEGDWSVVRNMKRKQGADTPAAKPVVMAAKIATSVPLSFSIQQVKHKISSLTDVFDKSLAKLKESATDEQDDNDILIKTVENPENRSSKRTTPGAFSKPLKEGFEAATVWASAHHSKHLGVRWKEAQAFQPTGIKPEDISEMNKSMAEFLNSTTGDVGTDFSNGGGGKGLSTDDGDYVSKYVGKHTVSTTAPWSEDDGGHRFSNVYKGRTKTDIAGRDGEKDLGAGVVDPIDTEDDFNLLESTTEFSRSTEYTATGLNNEVMEMVDLDQHDDKNENDDDRLLFRQSHASDSKGDSYDEIETILDGKHRKTINAYGKDGAINLTSKSSIDVNAPMQTFTFHNRATTDLSDEQEHQSDGCGTNGSSDEDDDAKSSPLTGYDIGEATTADRSKNGETPRFSYCSPCVQSKTNCTRYVGIDGWGVPKMVLFNTDKVTNQFASYRSSKLAPVMGRPNGFRFKGNWSTPSALQSRPAYSDNRKMPSTSSAGGGRRQ